ncbi:hypothetical protein GLAREA_02121 [Glarea lozoyensis ATCC 20868]|uniref:DUF6604 domain-containing protein n=1 Tax=Glarea lozoyensis (strain ATCC 20868 / MF5171) TaxID=1116229 RepID=S3CLY5_GLAL2|nr:uncharacterized protein GLAREA_02121 [Glarea lozoyensis ATCC 20868]EPE26209.1 hypothetical protein GLAREA_02121 [Glarea lozoyensis ATCC 20868]
MQSSTLGDTYAAYKASTTEFTTWLTGEAKARGYRSPNITSQTTTISCVELLKRVDFIVCDSSAKLSVPISIQNVLQLAIRARRKCSAWFEAMSDMATEVSEAEKQETTRDGHLHFIEVLEKALEHLTPFFGEPPKRKRTKAKKEAKQLSSTTSSGCDTGTLSNRFDILEIEVPQDDCNSGTLPSRQDTRVPRDGHSKAELKVDLEVNKEDDVKFVVFCFFEDLRELREFIQATWKDAMTNGPDISTASLITNVALDHVSKSEENITSLVANDAECLGNYWQVFRHIAPKEHYSSPENRVGNCAKVSMRDTIYLCIYHALRNYILQSRETQPRRIVPWVKPLGMEFLKSIDDFETLDVESEEWLIKMLHDLWLDRYYDSAEEEMTHIRQAGWFHKSRPTFSTYRIVQIEDSITRALKLALGTGSIAVTSVFAARIMLDIHKIVGNGAIKLDENLRHQAATFPRNLQVVCKTEHDSMAPVAGIAEPCCNFDRRNRESGLAWVSQKTRPRMANLKSGFMGLDRPSSMPKTKHLTIDDPRCIQVSEDPGFYYKNHPLWIGLESFRFEMLRMDYGMHWINCSASTPLAAHIYNAVRQASFLDFKWRSWTVSSPYILDNSFEDHFRRRKRRLRTVFSSFWGHQRKHLLRTPVN